MFIRKHYYDLTSGKTIWSYMMKGNFIVRSIDDELNTIPELRNRTLEDTGVMEWLEPIEEIESKMNGNYIVSVDVSVEPHALIFTERPKPEPIPEDEQSVTTEDCLEAFEELGVINKEDLNE